MSAPITRFPVHQLIPEPMLAFHPDRREDVHQHPLVGLAQFGPFSQAFSNYIYSPIRVGIIAPSGKLSVIKNLIAELDKEHQPRERKSYLVPYLGFSRVFRLRVVPAGQSACIEIPASVDSQIASSERPHLLLAETLNQAISTLQTHRTDFDVLYIYLSDAWASGFYGSEEEDFDLHDFIKGISAIRGIPVQIITDSDNGALRYFCRASVMWRLGIATYCKAGGIPWKLADISDETAYIGLSYAVRPSASGPRFVTCCSQVFDEDGSGLEFIAYETSEIHQDYENPYLNRTEMRRVMARSLRLYQQRHGGRIPKKVVVHKAFDFSSDEIEGCFDAWKTAEGLQLIQIQGNSLWRGISFDAPRKPGDKALPSAYPALRGSHLQIDGRSALLWTQGNAPTAVGGKNFFKEGKGIPKPLLLTRHAGHGGWIEDCTAILGLSKMNWNNDGLYDYMPVTLGYADVLAKTVKRIPDLAPKPYEFRFFM